MIDIDRDKYRHIDTYKYRHIDRETLIETHRQSKQKQLRTWALSLNSGGSVERAMPRSIADMLTLADSARTKSVYDDTIKC